MEGHGGNDDDSEHRRSTASVDSAKSCLTSGTWRLIPAKIRPKDVTPEQYRLDVRARAQRYGD